ncbi:Enoyl-CoA hydratase/isomerase, partial [mine drainage metagenome]
MACTHLLIEDAGAVRRITLNRADKLNALNRALLGELGSAMQQARHDDAVRVVVLAGAGDKAFVAGADITEMADLTAAQAQAFSQ